MVRHIEMEREWQSKKETQSAIERQMERAKYVARTWEFSVGPADGDVV